MDYKLNTKKPPLTCLILLISFPSAIAVFLSPALPAISNYFQITASVTQQLISVFIVGYALGQLVYSPFANRFGRKLAIYLGLSIYLLSSLICLAGIYIHSIEIVLFGRFLMALGSSVGMIISFTIINDFYYSNQARSITSYTVLAYAFVPATAIAMGGAITTYISWIGCFYFFIVYGVLMWLITALLPETLQTKNPHALKVASLVKDYSAAFRSKKLVLFSVIYGLMGAYVYIIASGGPFIGINEIGWSAALYGYLLLIPYLGQLLGALLAGKVNQRFSAYQVMSLGFAFIALGSVTMLICFAFKAIDFFTFLGPIFFIMMGVPKLYSNSVVMGLYGYKDKATGSAILSFLTMIIILVVNLVYSFFPIKKSIFMPLSFLAILFMALVIFFYVRSHYTDRNLPDV